MTTSRNNITGDALISKPASGDYLNNYDRIFSKKDSTELIISPIEDVQFKCPECGIDVPVGQPVMRSCMKAKCPVFIQFAC